MPPLESSAYGKLVTEFFCTAKGGTNTTENLICIWGGGQNMQSKAIDENNKTKPTRFYFVLCASLITYKLVACFQPWAVPRWHCHHAPRKNKHNYNHNGMSLCETLLCTHCKKHEQMGPCKHHPEIFLFCFHAARERKT